MCYKIRTALVEDVKKLGGIVEVEETHVVGAVQANAIEGLWCILERGVVGAFHKVSKKYLHLHLAESRLRYNNRDNADIFSNAIKGC
jgi:hypothetical protein